ncbi:hypothetical protein M422DRAFT_263562 [Sphaerobolus stellatus SS14]|uniref:Uncharacterized protein n=1 Tax=Sphaerobolus stellatus (strain SS14) TaxID=990650 RepID=A0A0C9UHW1_SPHS4|nr:hypothetical protein M422DRAFT_263562 [Sphaerobolus stellatus SS14]
MTGTQQYVAQTLPIIVELGKPNLNIAEESHDKHYKAHNASHHISHEPSLKPKKAPSASRGHGRGTTPKSSCTLVCSASLPAFWKTLSGLPFVPEDTHASQPNLPGHYASLVPSESAEDTPTGTPNPLAGGGPPGGGSPPPGGSPPDGGPDPNPNPDPNPDPDGGDGGRPPDDGGNPSSDDAVDEALNRSYKDGGNIKVGVLDTFNGLDPDKLHNFILGWRLYFRGNKQAFRSEANQVTFAILYLRSTVLDHFEPYILGEIPKVQMVTS